MVRTCCHAETMVTRATSETSGTGTDDNMDASSSTSTAEIGKAGTSRRFTWEPPSPGRARRAAGSTRSASMTVITASSRSPDADIHPIRA